MANKKQKIISWLKDIGYKADNNIHISTINHSYWSTELPEEIADLAIDQPDRFSILGAIDVIARNYLKAPVFTDDSPESKLSEQMEKWLKEAGYQEYSPKGYTVFMEIVKRIEALETRK